MGGMCSTRGRIVYVDKSQRKGRYEGSERRMEDNIKMVS